MLKRLLENGLKLKISIDLFREKKYNKVNPSDIKRIPWETDIMRNKKNANRNL